MTLAILVHTYPDLVDANALFATTSLQEQGQRERVRTSWLDTPPA